MENQARLLNEKLLILQVEYEEKNVQEEEIKTRLKTQLKEYSEDLLSLKKRRNDLFIERMENQTKAQKQKIKDQKKDKSKHIEKKKGNRDEPGARKSGEHRKTAARTSIGDFSANCRDLRGNERSGKCGNKNEGRGKRENEEVAITSVEQIWAKNLESLQQVENKERRKWERASRRS